MLSRPASQDGPFRGIVSARRFSLFLVSVVAALADGPAAHAAQAPARFDVFSVASPRETRALEARGTPVVGTALRLDAGAAAALRRARAGTLALPIAGVTREVTLEAFDVFAPGAVITSTGDQGPRPLKVDVTMFKGSVAGIPGSRAVLSFTADEVVGFVEWDGKRYVIAPTNRAAGATGPALHVLSDAQDLPAPPPGFRCDADDLDSGALRGLRAPRAESGGASIAPQTAAHLWCDIAIDCDYEFYAAKEGGNLTQAANYAATLIGVTSGIYETDVNVSIRISYLNIWTTSNDPYTANTTQNELPEFQNYFNANHPEVSRHTAHLLSGRALGGGIAYLAVLCNRPMGYAVSQVDGYYHYPTSSTTWDAYVLTHEIGHNFSSPHTQSCFWQENGYSPPGTLLDSCYAAEGGCYSGPTGQVPANRGTIMSYCHLLGPINSTIRLQFHSACKLVIRSHAEECLPDGTFDPQVSLTGNASGHSVGLDWNPSPTSGVIRYDVYRSPVSLDLNPQLAGSTTSTDFVDGGRTGTWFYRVRAVRSGDQSVYSNEVRVEVCAQNGTAFYESGPSAAAIVAADWNQDGIPDLAVTNTVPVGTVSLLAGQGTGGAGNGTYADPVTFSAGFNPAALATADFNEDGILDLAVTNDAGTGTFSILIGGGSGGVWDHTFAAPVSYAVGSHPLGILVRDFNEDGILDVATFNTAGSSVSIALGQGQDGTGDGTFAPATNVLVGSGPAGLAAADFNGDGILDLAVPRSTTGVVAILLGQGSGGRGNGSFVMNAAYGTGSNAGAVATGDFNQDGITDLAVVRNEASGFVSVLLGHGTAGVGDGTFLPRVEYATGPSPVDVKVADFNDDGRADLAVADGQTPDGSVALLFGRGAGNVGNGTFEAPVLRPMAQLPTGVTINDLDENGSPDLAVSHSAATQNAGVLLESCAPTLPAGVMVQSPNGGESWAATTEHSITWSKSSGVIAVNIEVSRDGGSRWEPVAFGVTGTSYPWTVTDPPTGSAQARVRVYDPTVPSRVDMSDAAFTIAPNPLLAVPGPVASSDFSLTRVFPNPAREGLFVAFSLPGGERATIELVDVAGRRVVMREVGSLGAGSHVVDLASGGGLRSGVYMVRLRRGGRVLSARAAVVR